ncbi:MAG: hypothetical protein WBW74_23925 [Xanthobacteraceae bacterium]
MIARKETKTITKKQELELEEPVPQVGQQKRPESGQFRLQVDRQTKRSYATYEAAEEAGMAIKKSYPLLQVAVYDLAASVNKIIEVPNAATD